MKSKPISQREARALKRRVDQLENMEERRRSAYACSFPGGTHLGEVSWDGPAHIASAVYTARRLGHAVVVVATDTKRFQLYAIRHPDMPQ